MLQAYSMCPWVGAALPARGHSGTSNMGPSERVGGWDPGTYVFSVPRFPGCPAPGAVPGAPRYAGASCGAVTAAMRTRVAEGAGLGLSPHKEAIDGGGGQGGQQDRRRGWGARRDRARGHRGHGRNGKEIHRLAKQQEGKPEPWALAGTGGGW